MKAYIHSFQGRPWNEDCEAAYRGFKELGIECVLFTTNEEIDEKTPEDIVVGGMLIMEHALKQMNVEIPNYNYPEELTRYLGRNVWTTKLKNIKNEKLPIFIKPVAEKIAKGIVVKEWAEIVEYNKLPNDTEIICSDAMDFVSEWRCFVHYGQILDVRFYNGDPNVKCEQGTIAAAIRDYIDIPAACSLDFGVTKDGRTLLIEMNDGFAIGYYGLEEKLYAKFLTARWAELIGVTDPLYK